MNNIKQIFGTYQKQFLQLANMGVGRKLLGIDKEVNKNEKIVGIIDNGYAVQVGRNQYKAVFRSYPIFTKRLYAALLLAHTHHQAKTFLAPQRNPLLYANLAPAASLIAALGLTAPLAKGLPIFMGASGDPIYASAGDGDLYYKEAGDVSWATVNGSANNVNYSTTTGTYSTISKRTTGLYGYAGMGAYPFDTSSVEGTVDSASLWLWIIGLQDYWTSDSRSRMDIIQTSQASLTVLATGDYPGVSQTASVSIDLGSLTASQYNEFVLDATGLTWIGATTKLAAVEGHLNDDVEPGAASGETRYSGITTRYSEQADVTNDPKLVVVFTVAGGGAFLLNFLE